MALASGILGRKYRTLAIRILEADNIICIYLESIKLSTCCQLLAREQPRRPVSSNAEDHLYKGTGVLTVNHLNAAKINSVLVSDILPCKACKECMTGRCASRWRRIQLNYHSKSTLHICMCVKCAETILDNTIESRA